MAWVHSLVGQDPVSCVAGEAPGAVTILESGLSQAPRVYRCSDSSQGPRKVAACTFQVRTQKFREEVSCPRPRATVQEGRQPLTALSGWACARLCGPAPSRASGCIIISGACMTAATFMDTLPFAAFHRLINLQFGCIRPHFKAWKPRELSEGPRGPGASIMQLLSLACPGGDGRQILGRRYGQPPSCCSPKEQAPVLAKLPHLCSQ